MHAITAHSSYLTQLVRNTVEFVNQNPCQKTREKIKLKRRKYSRAREREAQREGERENKGMERELFGPKKSDLR